MDKRKIIEEIKKIEWHYLVSRREALLFRSITDNGYSLFEKTTSLPWRPTRILRLGEGELFHSKKELETLRDMFSKGGMEPIKRFGRCLVKHVSALERFAKKLGAKDCAKLKDSELSRLAENYFEKALKAQNFLVPLPVADGVLSKKILERLPEAPMKQKEEWLMLLTYSDQENQHTLEEKSFLRLVQSYKKGQHGFNRQLERHLKHFSWIGVRGYNWEREWGKAAILDRIESFLAEGKDPLQKLKEMEATQKEVAKASKEWMAKQRISKGDDDYMLIKLAQQFTYWRTWRTDVIYRAGYEARNLLKEIAQRSNIPGEDIKYLTYKEVIKAAKGEDMPSKPEIENRKTYFAMFLSGENYHVLSGREWEMELRKHVLRARNQGQELKGNSAGPGMARGAAKVVLDANDLWKVGQGDILVAAMTFPHFIAAMEKAAAFVTDEGGITCHAAIIAREMRKPCVIGTKFATQILKDGDLVEVDADRGTVEILKGHRP